MKIKALTQMIWFSYQIRVEEERTFKIETQWDKWMRWINNDEIDA